MLWEFPQHRNGKGSRWSITDNECIRYAKLSLDNLPEDIATSGKYEIEIMVWDNETFAPVCKVIPFN